MANPRTAKPPAVFVYGPFDDEFKSILRVIFKPILRAIVFTVMAAHGRRDRRLLRASAPSTSAPRAHQRVMKEGARPPLGHRLGVQSLRNGERLERSL